MSSVASVPSAPLAAPSAASGPAVSGLRPVLLAVVLASLTLVGLVVSLAVGGHPLSLAEVIEAVRARISAGAPTGTPADTIVWTLRMPRAVLAVLVGLNLAAAGVLLQGIMRNPLAAPDIIGVTAGAALAATVGMVIAPVLAVVGVLGVLALPGLAFAGALAASIVVFALSWQPGVGTSPVRMILAGVAISAMLGGFQGFLMVYFSDRVQGVVLWLAGSLNTRSWHHVMLVAPFTLLGLALAATLARSLNLLQLGETVAFSLGEHVNRTRVIAIVAASLLTGAAVSAVGVIGFIGLVVPHVMRLLVGPSHGRLLLMSTLAGAVMLLWADIAARWLGEVPVGVITAIVGGPYFVALLYRRKVI